VRQREEGRRELSIHLCVFKGLVLREEVCGVEWRFEVEVVVVGRCDVPPTTFFCSPDDRYHLHQ
jgi:hypothetical protein